MADVPLFLRRALRDAHVRAVARGVLGMDGLRGRLIAAGAFAVGAMVLPREVRSLLEYGVAVKLAGAARNFVSRSRLHDPDVESGRISER